MTEDLFSISVDDELLVDTGTGWKYPDYCPEPLRFLPGRLRATKHGELFTQVYRGPCFTLGLLSTQSAGKMPFNLTMKKNAVYMVHGYRGSLSFIRAGRELMEIGEGKTTVCAINKGECQAITTEPDTCILFAVMDSDWIAEAEKLLPAIYTLHQDLQSGLFIHDALPAIMPDGAIKLLLHKIHTSKHDIRTMQDSLLESFLFEWFAACQEAYKYEFGLAMEVRCYALAHYSQHTECHMNKLIAHFRRNEKMLNRYFFKAFGLTINRYMLQLRMWKARHLMLEENHSVNEAGNAVGYFHPDFFTRTFTLFFNHPPKHIVALRKRF